jgi:hypothetical protein
MYRYEPNTPRVACAFAAVALAALTLAATVVWPAHVAAEDAGAALTIAARLNDPVPAAATGTVRASTETTAATTAATTVASASRHVNCVDVIAGRGATG